MYFVGIVQKALIFPSDAVYTFKVSSTFSYSSKYSSFNSPCGELGSDRDFAFEYFGCSCFDCLLLGELFSDLDTFFLLDLPGFLFFAVVEL